MCIIAIIIDYTDKFKKKKEVNQAKYTINHWWYIVQYP